MSQLNRRRVLLGGVGGALAALWPWRKAPASQDPPAAFFTIPFRRIPNRTIVGPPSRLAGIGFGADREGPLPRGNSFHGAIP
jgi:hypothetical protein